MIKAPEPDPLAVLALGDLISEVNFPPGGINVVASRAERLSKSAAIILEDAGMDQALPQLVTTSVEISEGQNCACISGILASRSRYEEIAARLTEAFASTGGKSPDRLVKGWLVEPHAARERHERDDRRPGLQLAVREPREVRHRREHGIAGLESYLIPKTISIDATQEMPSDVRASTDVAPTPA